MTESAVDLTGRIAAVVRLRQTCERSSCVIRSMASRPRCCASVLAMTPLSSRSVLSSNPSVAERITKPTVAATSISMSVKPSWERRRLMGSSPGRLAALRAAREHRASVPGCRWWR